MEVSSELGTGIESTSHNFVTAQVVSSYIRDVFIEMATCQNDVTRVFG
jgi:hypothetical protein